MITAYRQ